MSEPPNNVPAESVPRHVAIIMDGNGRWAQHRGLERIEGHRQGAVAARDTMLECARRGVEVLTLYSFSTENWKRPAEEIEFLMQLGMRYLHAEAHTLRENNIRFRHVGHRAGLSPAMLEGIDDLTASTAGNTGLTLALALNYGARSELLDAARRLARDAAAGRLDPESIDEGAFESRLLTAGLPDPDLLIRTAGEMRLSNFLLWQISYSELWVTQSFWPDFNAKRLAEAFDDYARRQRRYGGVPTA